MALASLRGCFFALPDHVHPSDVWTKLDDITFGGIVPLFFALLDLLSAHSVVVPGNPAQAGGPPAQVAGGSGELHLNIGFRPAAVAAAANSIAAFEFAVGSFDATAATHAALILQSFAERPAGL